MLFARGIFPELYNSDTCTILIDIQLAACVCCLVNTTKGGLKFESLKYGFSAHAHELELPAAAAVSCSCIVVVLFAEKHRSLYCGVEVSWCAFCIFSQYISDEIPFLVHGTNGERATSPFFGPSHDWSTNYAALSAIENLKEQPTRPDSDPLHAASGGKAMWVGAGSPAAAAATVSFAQLVPLVHRPRTAAERLGKSAENAAPRSQISTHVSMMMMKASPAASPPEVLLEDAPEGAMPARGAAGVLAIPRHERKAARRTRSFRRRQAPITRRQRQNLRDLWPKHGLAMDFNQRLGYFHVMIIIIIFTNRTKTHTHDDRMFIYMHVRVTALLRSCEPAFILLCMGTGLTRSNMLVDSRVPEAHAIWFWCELT